MISLAAALPTPAAAPRGAVPAVSGAGTATFVLPVADGVMAIAPSAVPAERQGDAGAGDDLPVVTDGPIALPDVEFGPVEALPVDRRFMAPVPVADPRSAATDIAVAVAAVMPEPSAILPEAPEPAATSTPILRPVVVERAPAPVTLRAPTKAAKRDTAPRPDNGEREQDVPAPSMPMVVAVGEPVPLAITAVPVSTADGTPSVPIATAEPLPAQSEAIRSAVFAREPEGRAGTSGTVAKRALQPAVRQRRFEQGDLPDLATAPVSVPVAPATQTDAAPVAHGSLPPVGADKGSAMAMPALASSTPQVGRSSDDRFRTSTMAVADVGVVISTDTIPVSSMAVSVPAEAVGGATTHVRGFSMDVTSIVPPRTTTTADAIGFSPTVAAPATAAVAPMLASVSVPPQRLVPAASVEPGTPWRFTAAVSATADAGEVIRPVVVPAVTPADDRVASVPVSSAIEDAAVTAPPPPLARATVAASGATIAAAPPTAAPAGVVFAPAIAASDERDRQPVRSAGDVAAEPVATGLTSTPTAAPVRVEAAMQAPLDLSQPRWPHGMVERIEALRDAADANDTRIRLVPDALGAIDIAVRREGDMVHVHFTAEQAQTRTLLQEAQPRLAEAAADRGLKLGQTSVDLGTAGQNGGGSQSGSAPGSQPQAGTASQSSPQGQGRGQGRQPEPAIPVRPTSATTTTMAETADDDARIA